MATKTFANFKQQEDYSKLSDKELLEVLKKLPEYKELVLPNKWYKDPAFAQELPEKKCRNMKEFLQEGFQMATAYKNYVEKVEIPAKPGGNRPIIEVQEVPSMTIIENNFSDGPTVHTLGDKETMTLQS
jgi:hypothetical protein